MARVISSVVSSKSYPLDYFPTAAVVAGQVLVREATASNAGEAADPAGTGSGGVTDVLDMLGLAGNASTVDTTPAQEPGRNLIVTAGGLENLVRVLADPFAVYRFQIAGGTAAGTALGASTATPANILSNDTADTTAPFSLITDDAVGSNDMSGGLIKGRTGNNAGAFRKLTSQSNSVSCTVGTGFVRSLAAGDTFIRVPYSRTVVGIRLVAEFTEANGLFTGSSAPFVVVNVRIDEARDLAWVDVVSRDHILNAGTL